MRSFTSSYNYTTSKLLLQGNWLRDKGFYIGNRVQVIALPELLIITPDTMIEKPSNGIITDYRLIPKRYRL